MHDKTYNKICMASKDSDQPIHLPSMARVLIYPSLNSQEAVEGLCDQWRLWSNCTDAQADLNLGWLHKSYCRFCHVLAHISFCGVQSVSTLFAHFYLSKSHSSIHRLRFSQKTYNTWTYVPNPPCTLAKMHDKIILHTVRWSSKQSMTI